MNIEFYIEELVLRGFNPADRHAIRDAVECELARLIAARGISALEDVAVPRLAGPAISITDTSQPAHLGHQIAGSVVKALPIDHQSTVRDSRRTA